MKTFKLFILGIITTFALVSCDNPLSLGDKLDLKGPVVEFTSPVPRKAVTTVFSLEGTITDDSGVKMLLIKVEKDGEELARQWRYSNNGWEISDNYGVSWNPLEGGAWEGNLSVTWSVSVDMVINGISPEDGEYMFSAQAWDSGEITDDNSFKTLILIIDNDPPKVSIIRPLLYDRYLRYDSAADKFDASSDEGKEIETLRAMTDWRSPEYISKFQTSSFPLQWGIEDNFNIWSFDLRFYEMDVEIDENKETPLPDNYVYRIHQNMPPVPEAPSPSDYVKPNGIITIPKLNAEPGSYGNGELKKQLPETQTTLRAVAICYDAANNVAQEKTVGYFIYWPQADIPWIDFSASLKEPEYYNDHPAADAFAKNVEDAFLVYPGVMIKAVAFHAQGIQSVTYSVKKIDEPLKSPYSSNTTTEIVSNETLTNDQPGRGKFDWEFKPEPRSAFYIVEAVTLSTTGAVSELKTVVFHVQDITFPSFPKPLSPPALEPLFRHIDNKDNSITISGIVDDATAIESLCLVWINPQSKNAATMAQLEYFRDPEYTGWKRALELVPDGVYSEQGDYDPANPNKVWRLSFSLNTDGDNSEKGINPETQRIEYNFSKKIPLNDLNIGIGKQDLKSQVFLLRASNPDPRVTIITYTPQGDEAPPVIKITNAVINGSQTLTPGQFGQINKFNEDDKIVINGEWKEDSIEYLDFNTYLKDNFKITVNQTELSTLEFTEIKEGDKKTGTGTWQAVVTVKEIAAIANDISLSKLKDTLVVSAELKDIGGKLSNDQTSWLIESDQLRLVRISSGFPDQTYNVGKEIDIFIEFNKPVKLKAGRTNPVLTLKIGNGTATAAYKYDPVQNTRQYFTYTVQAGHNTSTSVEADRWLDVSNLSGLAGGNYWEAGDYPFTWEAVSGTQTEEIRITMDPAHISATGNLGIILNNAPYSLRRLPVAANSAPTNNDVPYTLASGKNIGIDTTLPAVSRIWASNKAGHYPLGSEIIVNVVFGEAVKIADEGNPPQLRLQVNNTRSDPSNTLVTTSGTPKVNGDTVSFSYTVQTGDTTDDNKVIVDSFTGGQITDIAGNNMAAMNLPVTNRNLNGGNTNNGDGVYINTIAPLVPTFRALSAGTNNTANRISNNLGTAESGGSAVDIKNYYGDELYFAINGNTTGGNNRLGYLEYSVDPLSGSTLTTPANWKRIDSTTGAPFKQDILGEYVVRTRQTDKAGNVSLISSAVSLNWDPGNIVKYIDSSTPNGTYTNNGLPFPNTRADTINVTVYFRKELNTVTSSSLTLNARRGTGAPATYVTLTSGTLSADKKSISYTYPVGTTDNTPSTPTVQNLDVTALTIAATDQQNVTINNFMQLPANNSDRLINRKEIKVVTGNLIINSITYTQTSSANDEAAGNITVVFNRDISKRSGDVTVTQQPTGYRLPAVLTEAQANRYKNVALFNTYYSRGTNGFVGGAVDTTTKYVLDYSETTVVTPANTSGTAKLAYDFLQAEEVKLPVSSQDITVNGSTMTITLTGSNALQVLGAAYDIVIPEGIVQDALGYQSPALSATTLPKTLTTTGINRPFVRIDKKINADRITSNTGSVSSPHLLADYSGLVTTTARLDCRTPNANVRYTALGQEHRATGTDSTGSNGGYNWKNANNTINDSTTTISADAITYLSQQDPGATTGGTAYDNFSTLINVGTEAVDGVVHGYVWRIGVRGSKGNAAADNSELYEEIAFRTVLTYQLAGMTDTVGQRPGSGDQLWIRGGDAVGSSSVSGFPLNWQDDYTKLDKEKKRAGIRLLKMESNSSNTEMYTGSVWRWVTWEINVGTYFDAVLGRGVATGTAQSADDAWQYGPRQSAYQRGGWTASNKGDYMLYPGKHRICRTQGQANTTSGSVNFSLQFNPRAEQTVSFPQP